MFQFDETSRPSRRTSTILQGPQPTERALLFWGEHCVECAAPACYSSCDLFEPTANGRCRRFEYGVVRAPSSQGPSAEIRFRRWGKLETEGNAALFADATATRAERVLDALAPAVDHFGRFVARLTGQTRWKPLNEHLLKRLTRRLRKRAASGHSPSHFLAVLENLGAQPARLLLSIKVDLVHLPHAASADQLPPPFHATIDAPVGPSSHTLDLAAAQSILQSGLPFLISLTAERDGTHLVLHRLDLARLAEASSAAAPASASLPVTQPPAKLVVFDLDNTLWEGILLEGETTLREGMHRLFATLDERGILLSVASKNARTDAMARLEVLGLAEYLLHPQIGWLPKSQGLAAIAKAIDIGIDAVIFVDDNPFERAEVAGSLPQVEVLPETALVTLADHPRLQGAVTAESRARRQMYREAAGRQAAESEFGDDYLTFLKTCEIRVEIRRERPEDVERIVELVQRTNQLNFSGRKYAREEVETILADPARPRHVVICTDRFGSYGTVGFCLSHLDGETLVIDDLMLSCRVQGKFIEQALLWRLAEEAPVPVTAIAVAFRKTDRNRAAQLVLEKLGFTAGADGGYRRAIEPGDLAVDFLTVT